MNPLLWVIAAWMLAAPGELHHDGAMLRAAGARKGVPEEVMKTVAAVETGYSGRNDVVGAAGELGRMQIQPRTARLVGCPEPVVERLRESLGYNEACGARILRWCHDREHTWERAIRCYNRIDMSPDSERYLKRAREELGRMRLAAIDATMPRVP